MRISVASLLASICLGVATTATYGTMGVHARPQVESPPTTANTTDAQPSALVFNPADVVQVIVMGDDPNTQPLLLQVTDGGVGDVAGDLDQGVPQRPEVRNPFIETINVHRPFDDLIVTTPDVGPIQIVKVKEGKKSKSKRKPLLAPQDEFIYGEYMILRLRSITNELVQSIRASPEQPEQVGVVLTHTLSNTKVSSKSTTTGWESEATVTLRAEASGDLFGFGVSGSKEFSATVRRSVSTTFASSDSSTVTASKESSFTLRAGAGKEAALWMSKTAVDVYVCKSRTDKIRTNPIDGTCHFSHSVVEDGKRYEITIAALV